MSPSGSLTVAVTATVLTPGQSLEVFLDTNESNTTGSPS
jgi:hypothetical protein